MPNKVKGDAAASPLLFVRFALCGLPEVRVPK
jgi:hypothetical protein